MRSTKYYNNLDSSVIKKFGLDRLTDTVILRLLDVRMEPRQSITANHPCIQENPKS